MLNLKSCTKKLRRICIPGIRSSLLDQNHKLRLDGSIKALFETLKFSLKDEDEEYNKLKICSSKLIIRYVDPLQRASQLSHKWVFKKKNSPGPWLQIAKIQW